MSTLRRWMSGRRGSYAIEFALVAPVLVMGLAGTVDLAQYLILSDGVVEAVAEGARAGALAESTESPTSLATQMGQTSWSNAGLPGVLTLTPTVTGAKPDQRITVVGSVPYKPFFGFVKTIPTKVTFTSTLRLANQ